MSLLETLHRKKHDKKPQLKVFYWAFAIIFVWEVIPEYMVPILTAVNFFVLRKGTAVSHNHSQFILSVELMYAVVFTNIFGGGNGNEGLGFLSLCFDFQYIGSSALYLPLKVGTAFARL
jgi:hypothetical protein